MTVVDTELVRCVTADVVRRWRQTWLRPMQPPAGSHFAGDEDDDTGHFAIVEGGTVLCIASIYCQADDRVTGAPADAQWRLRGMATHPEQFSRGLGGQVLNTALAWAWGRDAEVVWCNARTPAVAFYQRHGFDTQGVEFELPDIGPHYLMLRRRL